MAKELEIKVKIDGQEIDIAKKSTKELTDQIAGLKDKLASVPIGSAEFKKIQGDIDGLEKGFVKAKQSTKGFVDNLSELPGIAGLAGQSLKGIKGGMDLLAENPLIAVFSLLATVILKVAEKMKSLEGVMDPLEKITQSVSGLFDVLANTILPPVAAIFEGIATGVGKVVNFFGELVGAGKSVGDNMSYVAETMDHLNDTNAQFALSQAEANNKLKEARELAADATKPIGERIQALKDADAIERKIDADARARLQTKGQAQAVELATSLKMNQQQIDAIKKYDAAQLKSFIDSVQQLKGLNREKSDALYASLAQIEDISAQEATIGKKTASQIRSIETEAANKSKEEAKAAADAKKDYEKRLADFKLDTRLQGIKDEQEKARISLENDKQKSLSEIDTLKLSNERKKQLKLAAEEDFAAKLKVLTNKQQEENEKKAYEFNNKVRDIEIAAQTDELKRATDTREEKYNRDVIAIKKDTEFKKKSAEEQAQILANIEKAKNVDIQKLKDDNAKKDADRLYKQIEFERQTRVAELQNKLQNIENEFVAEDIKIQERRQIQEEQAQIDRDKELENLKKLHDAKEISDDDFLKRSALQWQTYNTKITTIGIKTSQDLQKAKLAEYAAYAQLGQAIGAVSEAMGAETEAGKALKIASQGLILVSQTLTFVRQVQALTTMAAAEAEGVLKGASLPFPGNLVAIATTVATFASIIVSIKGILDMAKGGGGAAQSQTASPNSTAGKQGYGAGGLLEGPRHAQGGMMVNAEGGEAIMTRGAVTMFAPLLSQLNQLGGGTAFNTSVVGQANYDNPKSVQNPSSEPTIIKTYVVAQDMESMQHKQARLKDLSTL